jgi:GNAT superfamily N-acetyltransferase
VEFERIGLADVDRLRPLWLMLHAHHQQVAPELAPYVDDDRSWSVRRTLYEEILSERGFAVVARDDGADIGYALGAFEPTLWPSTFASAPEVAELETLLVRPDYRGRGVGSALLDEFETRASEAGFTDMVIGVVPGNTGAAALYRRRGFVPTVLSLSRFSRPPESGGTRGAHVEPVPASEIDSLRPLWLELHHHHQRVGPELGPFASDEASWAHKRPKLERAAEEGLLLRIGSQAMASVLIDRDNPLWADTWVTGRDVADVDVLSVTAEARGQGLGSALLDAIDERLAGAGVHDQVIEILAPNTAAGRLYGRRGFRPAWLCLSRFDSRLG